MAVNVVLGAGTGVGFECVQRLLNTTSIPVRAVVRDPSKYKETLSPSDKLQVVSGDVTDKSSLESCLKGAKGVIFAASGKGYWSADAVDHQGVANVAEVAKASGVERVVLVSSMLVTRKNWWHPVRLLLNNVRYGLMDSKLKGEDALRSSGISYTVVRPGGLTGKTAGQMEVVAEQGDAPKLGAISRADVAAVCVEALTNSAANKVTVEIKSGQQQASDFNAHLKTLWQGLKSD